MPEPTSPPSALQPLRRLAPRLTARCTDAALAGLALFVLTGIFTALTLPLQGDVYQAPGLVAFGVLMWTLKPLVLALPWRSWHPMAALAMPLMMITGLTGISVISTSAGLGGTAEGSQAWGSAYVGLYFLAFVHTGLWLPPRASWWLAGPAALSYPLLMGSWNAHVGLRLGIAAAVWVMTGELIAYLLQRQRLTEDALRAATRRDALTRLDNRRGLQARLEELSGGEVVAMVDLDHFKVVNDTRGHAGGDVVLADFAAMLSARLRAGDYAARYGGEEFLLVLTGTDLDGARDVLARLHAAWSLVHSDVTFSGGYAVHEAGVASALTVGAADGALYVAKRSGRDRDVCADDGEDDLPPAGAIAPVVAL